MDYIIDTYAWIEYFLGSEKGKVLRRLFEEQKHEFYTAECCLAEINGWTLKNQKNFCELVRIVYANSSILRISEQDWIAAGKERFEQRKQQKDFGLIDAVLLIKQAQKCCKVISGDSHFKPLKNVIFLE